MSRNDTDGGYGAPAPSDGRTYTSRYSTEQPRMDTGDGGGGGTDSGSTDDGGTAVSGGDSGPQAITVEPRNVYVSEGDRSEVRDDSTTYEFELSIRTGIDLAGTINPYVGVDAGGTDIGGTNISHTGTASIGTFTATGADLWNDLGSEGDYDLFVSVRDGATEQYEWNAARTQGADDLTLVDSSSGDSSDSPFYPRFVDVVDCSAPSSAMTGETVLVEVEVRNQNAVTTIFDLEVLVDGDRAGSTTKELGAASTRTFGVDVSVPDASGDYNLATDLEAWRRR